MPPRSLRRRRKGAAFVAISSLFLCAFLLLHGIVPNGGGWMSLVESMLPWTILVIVPLAVAASLLRSRLAGAVVVILGVVWGVLFLPSAFPSPGSDAEAFRIVSENVHANNASAGAIIEDLARSSPDMIAVQEMDSETRDTADEILSERYPFNLVVGTVGIWSRNELTEGERLGLGLGWKRALSVMVDTPAGPTRVFVVHLASFRPGQHEDRDTMLRELTKALGNDTSERVVVIGDFNTASSDRALAPVMAEVQEASLTQPGLGFTWPAAFPVARLDHALTRGFRSASSGVLDGNGSDHRGIELRLGLD